MPRHAVNASTGTDDVRWRKAPWIAAVLAIVAGLWLRWRALYAGFHGDDFVQMAMLRGQFPAHRSPLDLFRFADELRDGSSVIDFGYDPWFTEPDLKIAMFRPLASALIALDHRVFGQNAFYHHLHSLAWWVVVMIACAALYRKILPAPAAAIAILLFAIEEAHTVPVMWLANRSTLVATAFGLLGLVVHVAWRERASVGRRVLETALFFLALLGGEYAFSVLAYVLAFELLATKEDWRERVRALSPAVVAGVACLALRAAFGFGVRHSGAYVSPTDDPRAYLQAVIERAPVLVADLLWGIPASEWVDGWGFRDFITGRKWLTFVGLIGIAAGALLVRQLIKQSERNQRLVWIATGALLSILPGASALPEDRTLQAPAVGASAVFAVLLVDGYDAARAMVRKRPQMRWLLSIALAAAVVYVDVYRAWIRSAAQIDWMGKKMLAERSWALGAEIPDEGAAERDIVFISGSDFTTIANLPWVRLAYDHPLPHSYQRLSGALVVHEITREAPNVILLSALSSQLDFTMVGSLYRSDKAAFNVGDVVSIAPFKVEMLAIEGSHPRLMRFTFPRSLDDPHYLFLHSTPRGIRHFELPEIGKKLRLAAPEPPHYPG